MSLWQQTLILRSIVITFRIIVFFIDILFSHFYFSYMMIAPTIQQTRCKSWIKKHLPKTGGVSISDVTSMYTAICIMGPFSRSLLSELTDTDLSPSNFPFFTFKELDVGLANGIRAMNLTHTGELGYVLYIPNEVFCYLNTFHIFFIFFKIYILLILLPENIIKKRLLWCQF